jgi:hypothetical protein
MMPDGEEESVDIRTIPFYRFEDNETHTEGLYGIVIAGTDLVSPDTQHPHILKNLSIWNVWYGLRPQVPKMLIENARIKYAAYGIYRAEHDHHVYRNVLLTGIRRGPSDFQDVPTDMVVVECSMVLTRTTISRWRISTRAHS